MANRYKNVPTSLLVDEIGKTDGDIKARQELLDEMKEEFRRRGLNTARGTDFVVTASESTSKRLDTKRLQSDLGDALDGYYAETTSTRILIKPVAKQAD